MIKVELEQFQGPLDLLLQLIEEQKLDISQLALAQVTDQYLNYIDNNDQIDAMELADFLVVATKLLVIKSRILLPQINDEEEDSAEELENQLKLYKEYLKASKLIENILDQKKFSFSRDKLLIKAEKFFSPPTKLGPSDLRDFFVAILDRIDYIINLPEKIMAKTVSLKEMVDKISFSLANFKKINFNSVLVDIQNKQDAVVCFMALLELIKSGQAAVTQKSIFDDILIEKI